MLSKESFQPPEIIIPQMCFNANKYNKSVVYACVKTNGFLIAVITYELTFVPIGKANRILVPPTYFVYRDKCQLISDDSNQKAICAFGFHARIKNTFVIFIGIETHLRNYCFGWLKTFIEKHIE